MHTIFYKCLDYIGRWVNLIIILIVIFTVVGVAFAVTDNQESIHVSGEMQVILPIAFLGQLMMLAGYVGRSLSVQKNTSKAIEALGRKHDLVASDIGELKTQVSTLENRSQEHHRRISVVEKVQQDCNWFNRKPEEFVNKNGK